MTYTVLFCGMYIFIGIVIYLILYSKHYFKYIQTKKMVPDVSTEVKKDDFDSLRAIFWPFWITYHIINFIYNKSYNFLSSLIGSWYLKRIQNEEDKEQEVFLKANADYRSSAVIKRTAGRRY